MRANAWLGRARVAAEVDRGRGVRSPMAVRAAAIHRDVDDAVHVQTLGDDGAVVGGHDGRVAGRAVGRLRMRQYRRHPVTRAAIERLFLVPRG